MEINRHSGLLIAPELWSEGKRGEVPEWPKGADCKSAGDAFEGSNPSLSTKLIRAGIAQLVEREPSKLGVAGSSPVSRSRSLMADGRKPFHAPLEEKRQTPSTDTPR
jgi:hypothetical protein